MAGKNQFEAKTAFQNKASAKQSQTFESGLSGVLEDKLFSWKKSICPKDFIEAFSFFKKHTEGAVLLNFKWLRQQAQAYGKSATGAGRIIGPLSGGSARTRDQSDLRKRHFYFGRRNTTAEEAATRMLPPCRLSAGLVPVRLRQQFFPHKDITPQPPLVEPIEHLKTVGQL
ncbi:MAG: hypothetical protein J5710_06200 [Treponema sp.]|nr:hypothetical protein [Treponema sp.]